MLTLICFSFPTVTVEMSVTRPSPGETTAPASCGIARSGSRKNQRKKIASRPGIIAQAGRVSQPSTTAAANKANA